MTSLNVSLAGLLAGLVTACGSNVFVPNDSTSEPGGGGGQGDGNEFVHVGRGDAGADAAGATITAFRASSDALSEGQSITFVAHVSGALARAPALVDDQMTSYGALAPTGEPATYALALSWMELQERRSISFPPRGGTRAFTLLVDLPSGARLTATTTVSLRCEGGLKYGACGGQCVDFFSNPNCGACGVTCAACRNGVCATL